MKTYEIIDWYSGKKIDTISKPLGEIVEELVAKKYNVMVYKIRLTGETVIFVSEGRFGQR